MAPTLDDATSFDGFSLLEYMVREVDGYEDNKYLAQEMTFEDHYKAVSRIEGKELYKDKHRFYTLLRVVISNCRLSYCDKHETKKKGRAYRRYLV